MRKLVIYPLIPLLLLSINLGCGKPLDKSTKQVSTTTGAVSFNEALSITPGSERDLTGSATWLGVSTCSTCTSLGNVNQQLNLEDLELGKIYSLQIKTSYHTGNKIYTARNIAGDVDIFTEQKKIFTDQGSTQDKRNIWKIDFRAKSNSATIQLSNDGVPGELAYLYLSHFKLNEKKINTPENNRLLIGLANGTGVPTIDSQEFNSILHNPTYRTSAPSSTDLRPWIGTSDCDGCPGLGIATTQTIIFENLIPGEAYILAVNFSYLATQSHFYATANDPVHFYSGDIKINNKNARAFGDDQWVMEFSPVSNSLSVTLGLDPSVVPNYAYIDNYRLTKKTNTPETLTATNLSDWYQVKDNNTNGGLGYTNGVNNWDNDGDDIGDGGYAWAEIYTMQSYMDAYKNTGDLYWINKLIEHGDLILAQRDSVTGRQDYRGRSGPVWTEPNTNYAWIGFAGGLFMPLVELGRVVAENEYLQAHILPDGRNLFVVAQTYLMAYGDVLNFYEPDWFESTTDPHGYFRFPADLDQTLIGSPTPLINQPVVYDYGAFMATNYINLANYYKLVGDQVSANQYHGRAKKYAQFFRSKMYWKTVNGLSTLIWPFASYYEGSVDDVGHANVNVNFVLNAFEEGLAFTANDMLGIANMFEANMLADGEFGPNLIDGTNHDSFNSGNSTFYYKPLGCFSSTLAPKIPNSMTHNYTQPYAILDLGTWAHYCEGVW